jgi:hypothetical protein
MLQHPFLNIFKTFQSLQNGNPLTFQIFPFDIYIRISVKH